MQIQQELKSLKKALRALSYLGQYRTSTVTELAQAIGVPRPTSYRLLETLTSEGYVEKQPDSGSYWITDLVRQLGAGFQEREQVLEVAKPRLYALGEELGWPISLSMPRGAEMVVRITTDFDCAKALNRRQLGYTVPILKATTGYCHLAYCSESERERLLAVALSPMEKDLAIGVSDEIYFQDARMNRFCLTKSNKFWLSDVRNVIDLVRNQGFCNIEIKQLREGSLGVPIFLRDKPLGGIVMRYIRSAVKDKRHLGNYCAEKLKQASQEITEECQARFPEH